MNETALKALAFFAMTSLAGWILFFIGIGSRREQHRREEQEHSHATGRIADYVGREVRRGRGGTSVYWSPVIAFTADGQDYRLEYGTSLDKRQYPVGKTVDILYDVSDPTHFHLQSDHAFYHGAGNAMRIGLIWIALSLLLTTVLAVLVGGATIDFRHLRYFAGRAVSSGSGGGNAPTVAMKDDFQYRIKADSTAVIEGYSGDAASLEIPLLLDGHLVTGFSSAAFSRTINLSQITVPGQIAVIPMAAFAGCIHLSEVVLKDGVQSLGKQAFGICPSLKQVTLPASLIVIADDAFPDDCPALFHVVEGSSAEQYCLDKGFEMRVGD